jgi:hypothetical protein
MYKRRIKICKEGELDLSKLTDEFEVGSYCYIAHLLTDFFIVSSVYVFKSYVYGIFSFTSKYPYLYVRANAILKILDRPMSGIYFHYEPLSKNDLRKRKINNLLK